MSEWSLFLQSISFGVVVALIVVGMIGTVIPAIPGTLIVWLSILLYAWADGFVALGWGTFVFITLIALVTGTADFWLPLLGAKSTGASRKAMILGPAGALLGALLGSLIVIGTLPGALIGYALGLFLGQYWETPDWQQATKATLGGLAGYGLSAIIQFGGGLIILIIFLIAIF